MSPIASQQRDRDCAFLARAVLFPLRISRDGTHPTIFPAVEALDIIRTDAMEANPQRVSSSFFPPRVVVVKASASENDGRVQWNGMPDISKSDASFDVVPGIISVRCMECAKYQPGVEAFIQKAEKGREIVLCSDRLLKKDYTHDNVTDLPKKSLAVVEEVLAHQVTKIGTAVKFDNDKMANASCDPATCQGLATAEILAARVSECYYAKAGKEVKRGSGLPTGYSLLPEFLQQSLRGRCIRSVATKATEMDFAKGEGKKCVEEMFDTVMADYS
jgi:hypothetical protein